MPPPVSLQTDLGSLNGTLLNNRVVSKEYRKCGEAFPLLDQDTLELGSTTTVRVACRPSNSAKRQHLGTLNAWCAGCDSQGLGSP